MSGPDRIWADPDYNDHHNPVRADWTLGVWSDSPDKSSTQYLLATPPREKAEELVEALRMLMKYRNADAGLSQIAEERAAALLASLEAKP